MKELFLAAMNGLFVLVAFFIIFYGLVELVHAPAWLALLVAVIAFGIAGAVINSVGVWLYHPDEEEGEEDLDFLGLAILMGFCMGVFFPARVLPLIFDRDNEPDTGRPEGIELLAVSALWLFFFATPALGGFKPMVAIVLALAVWALQFSGLVLTRREHQTSESSWTPI